MLIDNGVPSSLTQAQTSLANVFHIGVEATQIRPWHDATWAVRISTKQLKKINNAQHETSASSSRSFSLKYALISINNKNEDGWKEMLQKTAQCVFISNNRRGLLYDMRWQKGSSRWVAFLFVGLGKVVHWGLGKITQCPQTPWTHPWNGDCSDIIWGYYED